MITFHADDFGVNLEQSKRILATRKKGVLNSVSVMPNSRHLEETIALIDSECKVSIHINLAEGHCLSQIDEVTLFTDNEGYFCKSFIELLWISIIKHKKLMHQAETEIFNQISSVLAALPKDYKMRIDSHVHYHMIPTVFNALCKALKRTGREIEYLRYPTEKLSIYMHNLDLLRKIPIVNFIKIILLDFFGFINRRILKQYMLEEKTGDFVGVAYTGHMSFEVVEKIFVYMRNRNSYDKKNLEILFHPGGIGVGEEVLDPTNSELVNFYRQKERSMEADALLQLRKIL